MKLTGKILFFGADTGQGMIMTSDKRKINFTVAQWDDFETMPSLGLEVQFTLEGDQASNIVSLNYVEEESNNTANTPQENAQQNTQKEESPQETHAEEKSEGPKDKESTRTQKQDEETAAIEESDSPNESENEKKENKDNTTEEFVENPEAALADANEAELKEKALEHFEEDPEIAQIGTLEDAQEEIGEREESVTLTMNISLAVKNYFDVIDQNVVKRKSYKKVNGRLDYLLVRRFLWTIYNNLSEIDLEIITPKIKALSADLREMATIFNDFTRKTKHPGLAFEEVFLSCQQEYNKIREGAEKTVQRLNQLKTSEKYVGSKKEVKKDELSKAIDTEEFDLLQGEFKSLSGTYVDIVHMMAELDERYKHDMKLLKEFEDEYKADFTQLFNAAAAKYKKGIVDILSAQAFVLDGELWNKAKTSKAVKAHFHKSNISGEFNTRTYLKYYLDTQDEAKASEESKRLFELYDYLTSLQKENIMIVRSDANEAMECEAAINKIDKSFYAKGFIDEKAALQWAIKNNVHALVLESSLSRMQVETFLAYYQKYVLVIPKIILLGNMQKHETYQIHKLLSRGSSPQLIAKNVKEIMAKPDKKEES